MKANPGLRQLPDGRWRFRTYVDGTKTGRRVQVTLEKGTTHAEALRAFKAAEAKAAARKGRPIPRRLTFSDAADEFLAVQRRRLSDGTLDTLEPIVRRLVAFLGTRRVEDLRPSDVAAYQASRLEAGIMPSTTNTEVTWLLAIVRKMFAFGWVDRDPLPRGSVETLPTPAQKSDFFSSEEWRALISSAERLRPDGVPILRALLLTAARVGELCALTWGSVDLEAGRVTIAMPKRRGVEKTLPLSGELHDLLEALPRGLPAAPVFTREDGSPWSVKAVQSMFYRVRNGAGIRGALHVHSVRHTAASWAVQSGVPLLTVKETLGHSTIAQTERYSHLLPEHLRAAVEAVSSVEKAGLAPLRRHRRR